MPAFDDWTTAMLRPGSGITSCACPEQVTSMVAAVRVSVTFGDTTRPAETSVRYDLAAAAPAPVGACSTFPARTPASAAAWHKLRASNHSPTFTAPNVRVRTKGNRMAISSVREPRSRRRCRCRVRGRPTLFVLPKSALRSGRDGDPGPTLTRATGHIRLALLSADLVLVVHDRVDDDDAE